MSHQNAAEINSEKQLNKKKRFEHAHFIMFMLVIYDLITVSLSFFAALLLRFDFRFSMIPATYLEPWIKFAPFYAIFCIIVFWLFKLYKSIWRFASFTELKRISIATGITGVAHILFITLLLQRMPISYYCIGIILQFCFCVFIRFAYRFILLIRSTKAKSMKDNAMIIGSGAAGVMLLRDIRRTGTVRENVICLLMITRINGIVILMGFL